MSVVNLFELSRNFNRKDQAWLMDKYIQQQEPLQNVHGTAPQTPAPTLTQTPYNDNPQGRDTTSAKERERPTEMWSSTLIDNKLEDKKMTGCVFESFVQVYMFTVFLRSTYLLLCADRLKLLQYQMTVILFCKFNFFIFCFIFIQIYVLKNFIYTLFLLGIYLHF